MKKKTILMFLSILAVTCISVLGTLAYLTDSDTTVNTFTVGQVDIMLDEAKVNAQGQPLKSDGASDIVVDVADADRVQENAYHLIPGLSYVKDPTITVAKDSEDAYVRMMVTLNYAKELKAIFGDNFLPQDYVEGWDPAVWECVDAAEDTAANTVTYEFRYRDSDGNKEIVEKAEGATEDNKLTPLFTSFKMPGKVTGEQLATLVTKDAEGNITNQFAITVVGHAIQAAGFVEDTAGNKSAEDVAWAAFDSQMEDAVES